MNPGQNHFPITRLHSQVDREGPKRREVLESLTKVRTTGVGTNWALTLARGILSCRPLPNR
jgi:hypothetical protein